MSQPQRMASSMAFFNNPFFLFRNVTCRFRSFLIRSIRIFFFPILPSSACCQRSLVGVGGLLMVPFCDCIMKCCTVRPVLCRDDERGCWLMILTFRCRNWVKCWKQSLHEAKNFALRVWGILSQIRIIGHLRELMSKVDACRHFYIAMRGFTMNRVARSNFTKRDQALTKIATIFGWSVFRGVLADGIDGMDSGKLVHKWASTDLIYRSVQCQWAERTGSRLVYCVPALIRLAVARVNLRLNCFKELSSIDVQLNCLIELSGIVIWSIGLRLIAFWWLICMKSDIPFSSRTCKD